MVKDRTEPGSGSVHTRAGSLRRLTFGRAAVTGAEMAPKGLLRRSRFNVSFGYGSQCAVFA